MRRRLSSHPRSLGSSHCISFSGSSSTHAPSGKHKTRGLQGLRELCSVQRFFRSAISGRLAISRTFPASFLNISLSLIETILILPFRLRHGLTKSIFTLSQRQVTDTVRSSGNSKTIGFVFPFIETYFVLNRYIHLFLILTNYRIRFRISSKFIFSPPGRSIGNHTRLPLLSVFQGGISGKFLEYLAEIIRVVYTRHKAYF